MESAGGLGWTVANCPISFDVFGSSVPTATKRYFSQTGCVRLNRITLTLTYRECADLWYTVVIMFDDHEASLHCLKFISAEASCGFTRHVKFVILLSFFYRHRCDIFE